MLRQAEEESKVRTVKLARAPYSGGSPPAISLPSYRSTPSTSTLPDAGSPEVGSYSKPERPPANGSATGSSSASANSGQSEDGKTSPAQLLHDVGIAELLELDQRPTVIIDLGDPLNYGLGSLKVLFANSSLRSNLALFEAVKGRVSAISPRSDPQKAFSGFKSWITSAAVNGESLDVCLPAFVHGGVQWSCSTLRKRLRVASASAASLASSHSSSSPRLSSLPARTASDAPPTTSTGSFHRMHEEPSDYFGNATVEPVPLAAQAKPLPDDTPSVVPSIELQGATSSSDASRNASTTAHIHPVANGAAAPHSIPASDLLASHPSLTNELVLSAHVGQGSVDRFGSPSQDELGFFDWTRLPYSDNLPRHIKFARSIDWASTSLGPIELWNADLRQMCNLIMASPHPAGKAAHHFCAEFGEMLTVANSYVLG